mgnify:FL=1
MATNPTQQVQQISDIILNQLIPGLQGLIGPMTQVGGSVNDLNKNLKFQKEQLAIVGAAQGKFSQAYKDQAKITAEARDKVVEMNKAMSLLNKKYDEHRSVLDKATSAMKVFGSVTAQAMAFMGGSAINFSKMRDQVLAYNKNLLDTSKAMQAFGRGTNDLNAAFAIIRTNTSLSKTEFVGMTKAIMESANGIGPSLMSIANMSASMEAAFGSDLDTMKAKMQSFASLMEKSPALFRTATKAMNIAQNVEKGDVTKARNDLIQAAKSMHMSHKEIMDMLKATSPMTSAQKALNESEAAIKKVKKGVDDAALAAGQKLEKAFQSCTLFAAKLLDVIEKMPSAILAVVVGLKGIPAIMQAIHSGGGGFGGIGGGLKGMWDNFKSPTGLGNVAINRKIGARAGVGGAFALLGFGANYLQNEIESKYGGTTKTSNALGIVGGLAQGAGIGAMLGGPLGAGIGAGVGALYGMYQNKKHEKELAAAKAAKQKNDALQESVKLENDVQDALGRQIALESELMSNYENTAKLAKEIAESWNQAANNVKELGTYSAREQEFLEKQLVAIRERNKSATDSKAKGLLEGSDAEAIKQLGVNPNNYSAKDITGNTEKFNELISMLQASVDKKAEAINNDPEIRAMNDKLEKLKVELKRYTNEKGEVKDSDDAKRNAKRILNEQEKITIAKSSRTQEVNSGQALINRLVDTRNEAAINVKEDIKRKVEARNLEVDASELLNNALERQLEIQNKLYSSAQFGMGASIQMMQEQVNLTKEQMELQQKRQMGAEKDIKNALMSQGVSENIADTFMKEVQAGMSYSKSKEKLGEISKRYGLDEVNLGQQINLLLVNRSDAMSKQMQAQQKIYELTKEVREGYLDAQREMSVGAGIFAKTIGTQTAGVDQLMDIVNKFGEKGSLNTLKLGGQQTRSQTVAGMGMNPMAMNTANGMVTKDTNMINAENTRIYKYEQSIEEAKNGKIDGRVGDSVLGDVSERFSQALREEGKKATEDGTLAALEKAASRGIFGAINPGASGFKESSTNPNANGVVPNTVFSQNVARAAKGANPASPPMMQSNPSVSLPQGAQGSVGGSGQTGPSSSGGQFGGASALGSNIAGLSLDPKKLFKQQSVAFNAAMNDPDVSDDVKTKWQATRKDFSEALKKLEASEKSLAKTKNDIYTHNDADKILSAAKDKTLLNYANQDKNAIKNNKSNKSIAPHLGGAHHLGNNRIGEHKNIFHSGIKLPRNIKGELNTLGINPNEQINFVNNDDKKEGLVRVEVTSADDVKLQLKEAHGAAISLKKASGRRAS